MSELLNILVLFFSFNANVEITVLPYRFDNVYNDIELQGFTQKLEWKEHSYIIFYKEGNYNKINFLLHELAHIEQYESGRLESINGVLYWDGKEVKDKYMFRPHEIETNKRVYGITYD